MTRKVESLPGLYKRRKRLDKHQGIVRCEVSSRWLQMPKEAVAISGNTYLAIDVLTDIQEGKQRKLCQLVILKEDLLDALNAIPVRTNKNE
ncbi:MAG: hypothetical protein JWR07_5113 [Nevskia sp.]|nr:hypothetical protein [Nevskia sp.]